MQDADGKLEEVRSPDGLHFEPAGGDIVAKAVMKRIEAVYDLRDEAPTGTDGTERRRTERPTTATTERSELGSDRRRERLELREALAHLPASQPGSVPPLEHDLRDAAVVPDLRRGRRVEAAPQRVADLARGRARCRRC